MLKFLICVCWNSRLYFCPANKTLYPIYTKVQLVLLILRLSSNSTLVLNLGLQMSDVERWTYTSGACYVHCVPSWRWDYLQGHKRRMQQQQCQSQGRGFETSCSFERQGDGAKRLVLPMDLWKAEGLTWGSCNTRRVSLQTNEENSTYGGTTGCLLLAVTCKSRQRRDLPG